MEAPCRVRPVRSADLEAILAIERASFRQDAYDRNLFAYFVERCPGLFLVAESRGRICGYMISCLCGEVRPLRAELVSVAVAPAARGAGVATSLMNSTLRRLRRRGAVRLHLIVNVKNRAARAFYEKYGFRKLRTVPRYYERGGDGILMSRPVTLP